MCPRQWDQNPGFRRPVIVVQGDALNRSRIATVVCVPLTSNLKWSEAPGNVLLKARITSLAKDSVANVSQLVALDKSFLTERVGKLPAAKLELSHGLANVSDRILHGVEPWHDLHDEWAWKENPAGTFTN